MSKVKRIQTSEFDHFRGYLHAAQHIFIKGQLKVTLEAVFFEILDKHITDEEVIRAAYPDGINPIEHCAARSSQEMISGVNTLLTTTREFRNPKYSIPEIIESHLREGYWQHLMSCCDYVNSRIVELGPHVPFVNICGGFTYLLYASDMSRCLLLIGNTSD